MARMKKPNKQQQKKNIKKGRLGHFCLELSDYGVVPTNYVVP